MSKMETHRGKLVPVTPNGVTEEERAEDDGRNFLGAKKLPDKELKICDKRTIVERYLDTIAELNAVGSDERLHILDRIDAYLELALLTYKDPHKWMSAVHNARDLIKQDTL